MFDDTEYPRPRRWWPIRMWRSYFFYRGYGSRWWALKTGFRISLK